MNNRQGWVILLPLFVLLVGLAVTIYFAVAGDRCDMLTVAFLDVGQGDAIYIETPDGV